MNARPKILHVEPLRYPAEIRELLHQTGDVTYRDVSGQEAFEAALAEEQWDCVFVRLGVALTARALQKTPTLRFVVTPTTGHDHLDEAALESRGVRLISLRGEREFLARIRSTAEHTIGLMLALMRRTVAAHSDVVAGRWRREPFLGEELFERKLGILGMGRLGSIVAEIALAFGMDVAYVDVDPSAEARAPSGAKKMSLSEVLSRSDVVTLHLPLYPDTVGYLGKRQLDQMKPGAFLVNTARGELVAEDAVVDGLKAERFGGYATDVLAGDSAWDRESPLAHPLISLAADSTRVLVTPHIGGYGRDSIEGTRKFVIKKFARAYADQRQSK